MGQILTSTVRHPSAWYGKDLAGDSSWIVRLGPRHLEEIAMHLFEAASSAEASIMASADRSAGGFTRP